MSEPKLPNFQKRVKIIGDSDVAQYARYQIEYLQNKLINCQQALNQSQQNERKAQDIARQRAELLTLLQRQGKLTVELNENVPSSNELFVRHAQVMEFQAKFDTYRHVNEVMGIVEQNAALFDQAKNHVFVALLFPSSDGWNIGLKQLQGRMNDTASTLLNSITWGIQQTAPQDLEVWQILENQVIFTAGIINDAIYQAIGGGDGGVALRHVAEKDPEMSSLLREKLDKLQTVTLARDKRYRRALVYIGTRCNDLEAQGTTRIRDQWETIYRELRPNQDFLEGDQKDAWEWFQYQKPKGMTATELRGFEQEISRMKRNMKSYVGGEESSDKLPTK